MLLSRLNKSSLHRIFRPDVETKLLSNNKPRVQESIHLYLAYNKSSIWTISQGILKTNDQDFSAHRSKNRASDLTV